MVYVNFKDDGAPKDIFQSDFDRIITLLNGDDVFTEFKGALTEQFEPKKAIHSSLSNYQT